MQIEDLKKPNLKNTVAVIEFNRASGGVRELTGIEARPRGVLGRVPEPYFIPPVRTYLQADARDLFLGVD